MLSTVYSPRRSSDSRNEGECDICNALRAEWGIQWADLQRSAAQGLCKWCHLAAKAINVLNFDVNTGDIQVTRDSFDSCYFKVFSLGEGRVDVEIFVLQSEDVPAWIHKQRLPSGSTSSAAALRWTKEWIDHCEKEHMMCRHIGSFDLPTRLIDVTPINEHGDVKLVLRSAGLRSKKYTGEPNSYC
jgi:hypothetical protein